MPCMGYYWPPLRNALLLMVFVAVMAGGRFAWAADVPTIAAASDLQFALTEVAGKFKLDTGLEVRLTFGSSGNFTRQIREGAPFELFLSADEDYALALAHDGFAQDDGVLYAIGRIVIMVPRGSSIKPDGSLSDLGAALAAGRLSKFAIANPEHAPYGKRAEEALRHAGLWEAIVPHLVRGENVSQTAQFATSGSTEGGIIAYSLALSPAFAKLGAFALIPESWHTPLRQRMVVLKNAGPVAKNFFAYLQESASRTILRRYGFVPPLVE